MRQPVDELCVRAESFNSSAFAGLIWVHPGTPGISSPTQPNQSRFFPRCFGLSGVENYKRDRLGIMENILFTSILISGLALCALAQQNPPKKQSDEKQAVGADRPNQALTATDQTFFQSMGAR